MIINTIQFPTPTGIKCNMMPFIQGDPDSLPLLYRPYSEIIEQNFLQPGERGLLTIDEAFVPAGESQRGFNSAGIKRNVHIEVGIHAEIRCWGSSPDYGWGRTSPEPCPCPKPGWGGSSWGGRFRVLLDEDTEILIANSISDTCRVWDVLEKSPTPDGDLSMYIDRYPEETGWLLKAGEVAKISIFTPHEAMSQTEAGYRQFFRIVGRGVHGREDYFTINPLVD